MTVCIRKVSVAIGRKVEDKKAREGVHNISWNIK